MNSSFHFLTGLCRTLSCQLEKSLPCWLILRVRAQALKTSTKEVFLPLLVGREQGAEGTVHRLLAVSAGR